MPKCPRCGGKLRVRQASVERYASTVLKRGWNCAKCGSIDRKDFPPDELRRMDNQQIIYILIGLALSSTGLAVVLILAFRK